MAADADEAQDAEAVPDRGTVYGVDKTAPIVSMDLAGPLCPATGTNRKFRAEPSMKELNKIFEDFLMRIREFSFTHSICW